MSSSSQGSLSMEDLVTIGDVHRDLNYIERVLDRISGDDEYLEAILQNQRTQLLLLLQQASVGGTLPESDEPIAPIDRTRLPRDLVGTATVDIPQNAHGSARFELNGSTYHTEIHAVADIDAFEPVRIVGPGNDAEPLPDETDPATASRPVERASVFGRAVSANADILQEPVRPRTTGTAFRVSVVLADGADFSARLTHPSGETDIEFNSGNTLSPNGLYTFDMALTPTVDVNFRVSAPTTVEYLVVTEVLQG